MNLEDKNDLLERIKVCRVSFEERHQIGELINNYRWLYSGQFYLDVAQFEVASEFLKEITESLRSGSLDVWIRRKDEKNDALLIAQDLSRDSDHFGLRMARLCYLIAESADGADLLLSRYLEECRARGVDHISTRINAGDEKTAQILVEHGFRLVGTKAMLRYSCEESQHLSSSSNSCIAIRDFRPSDAGWICSLAGKYLATSRFVADGRFEFSRISSMYANWALEVCRNDPGNIVVAEANGEEIGFTTFTIGTSLFGAPAFDKLPGIVSLIAVKPAMRQQGAGTLMVKAAVEKMKSRRCQVIWASTNLGNTSSLRIFQNNAFRVATGFLELHLWL